ncbi:MAG TPA: MFS transporter [Candidatus Binatia bacterium]|jgi:MFS family permease|nr:MFS transporter [Candidatus Binatia bacterium]
MPDKEPAEFDTAAQGPFAALYYRDFRLFWTGLFISNVGSWMQITATSWLLYEITHSPLQLGLNGLFRAVPTICFGLLGGTLTDRYDRRRLLLFTQATLMLLAFLLGILAQTGLIQVWHIYALTLVSAVVGTLDGPARQALYPSLVPRSALSNAIALNSLLWKGTVLLGPSLAGIAISTIGTDGAFYANALSFLSVIVALFLMETRSSRTPSRGEFLKDLKEGVSYVFSQKIILGVMGMEAASAIFGLDQAMLTIFASDILRAGATGLGFLQSARGLGAIAGSGLLIFMGEQLSHGKILFVSALLYGASFAIFGLSNSLPLSLFLLLIAGATDTIWGAARNTILQLQTKEGMRGRVMGIFQLSNRGLSPLGQVETGLVVPLVGAKEATFIGGLIVTAVTLFTGWRVPSLPRFRWEERQDTSTFEMDRPGEP